MKRFFATILTAALLLANVSNVFAQQTVRSNEYWMKYTSRLPIGATVRVRTTDGKRRTAILAIVDETGITLEPKTRVPEPPMHVPYDRLDQLELQQNNSSSAAKAAGIGVAVGVGTFFALLAILASAWD